MKQAFTTKQYALLAASYLAGSKLVNAQAIYTDLDPDSILNNPYISVATIDMDSNGIDDFTFVQFHKSYSTGTFSLYFVDDAIDVGPRYESGVNAIAGTSHYAFSAGLYIEPYALEFGTTIDSHFQFNNLGFQGMAAIVVNVTFGGINEVGFWQPESIDHYLGVRFLDEDSCLHYGWIRCDVLDSAKVLVIKDYAYELKCDTPIKAGDMVGDTTVAIHNLQSTAASIYAFNKSIYIHLPQLPEPNTEVLVYDMLGRELYRQGIKTTSTQIHLNTAAGIYLVTIQDKEGRYSKKVLVE